MSEDEPDEEQVLPSNNEDLLDFVKTDFEWGNSTLNKLLKRLGFNIDEDICD